MIRNALLTTSITAAALLAVPAAAPVWAQRPAEAVRAQNLQSGGSVEMIVPLFKSRLVSIDGNVGRVAVGSPEIADIVVTRPNEIYVLGKDVGTTNVLVWNRDNVLIGSLSVEVGHDLENLKAKLFELFPGEKIEVRSAQRSLVVSGQVSSASTMNAIVQLADGYLSQVRDLRQKTDTSAAASSSQDKGFGQVINLLQVAGSQQVMLEVKVAEVARTEVKRIAARFNAISNGSNLSIGAVNGGASFPDAVFQPTAQFDPFTRTYIPVPGTGGRQPIFSGGSGLLGPMQDEFRPNDLSILDKGLFASFLNDNFLMNLALDAAKEKGVAKILAEPTLTTLSGQEAHFLSGGEFPIPVPDRDGITIQFKEYGVMLKFIPYVLNNGHINLKINIQVSELVSQNAIAARTPGASASFVIPALSKREAAGTVELGDGQTMGLAGLMNDNLRDLVQKFPGLGSIPVLGALFRSQEFQKGQSELLILVTPHLAKPVAPGSVSLPTDRFVEPSDSDFYLWGRGEGKLPAKAGVKSAK